MSKLDLKLSYKNACILKHALRDKIKAKETYPLGVDLTELEEERRALKAVTDEIKRGMGNH